MMYLWPQSSSLAHLSSDFGVMTAPASKMVPLGIVEGRWWACDNGAFSGAFDEAAFMAHLDLLKPYKERCLFVVAPDVWGDVDRTLEKYSEWRERLSDWPVALAAQDGFEDADWPDFDWLFIGGTNKWRGSMGVVDCINRARRLGKTVHVGRVNSQRSYEFYRVLGCRTCDGTHPIYEPDAAAKRIERWMNNGFSYSLFSRYRGG